MNADCKQCGIPIPESFKFCKHCGAPAVPATIAAALEPATRKKNPAIWIISGSLMVIFMIFAAIDKGGAPPLPGEAGAQATPAAAEPIQRYTPAPEIEVITARQILRRYEANEIRADQELKDKEIGIDCFVGGIKKSFTGAPYIECRTGQMFTPVNLNFPRGWEERLGSLTTSNHIIVTCKMQGMMIGSPYAECSGYTGASEQN